jgi:VIT1/CCC1 family predicted Fe2+/Mn2+ transporter
MLRSMLAADSMILVISLISNSVGVLLPSLTYFFQSSSVVASGFLRSSGMMIWTAVGNSGVLSSEQVPSMTLIVEASAMY